MPKFSVNQKIPNASNKPLAAQSQKTKRVQLHPVNFPVHEGDLGILNIQSSDIPKQAKAATRTGDAATNTAHDTKRMKKVMKRAGRLA